MLTSLGIAGLIAIAVFITTAAVVILTRHENAELKKALEEVRGANLALEAKIAPRRIDSSQSDAIARALESFSGKSVNFDSYILDVEAAGLGEQLAGTLRKAKISADPTALRKRIPGGTISEGLKISGKDDNLVMALLAALKDAGLTASRGEAEESVSGIKREIIIGGLAPAGRSPVDKMRGLAPSGVSPWDATVFVGVKPLPAP